MFLLLLLLSCMNYLLLCNKLSQNIIAKTINIQCYTVSVSQETGGPLSWLPPAQCFSLSCSPPVGQSCSYLETRLGRRICFQDHSRGCHRLQIPWALDCRPLFLVTLCGYLHNVTSSMAAGFPQSEWSARGRGQEQARENTPGGSHNLFAA